MDWVEDFYLKQHDWLADHYFGDITELHRMRAEQVSRLAGPPPRRVLELGAGGGQDAAAAADLGFDVTAIELLPAAADHGRELARGGRREKLAFVQGNFYDVELADPFDIVCYWDGFGIGSDADQSRLLHRINDWLTPNGVAMIEVYTPWYWARAAGQEARFGPIARRYGFDAEGCRMLDRWWPVDDESAAVEQSLRCYSPVDLKLLLKGTGLSLCEVEPGGAIDEATGRFVSSVSLEFAMSFVAKLAPST